MNDETKRPEQPGDPNRRDFLRALGLAMATAAIAACTRAPDQKIVPYVHQPPEITPGVPRFYATSFVEGGYATGLLVENHEGRPTKVEGNPRHPMSLGATSAIQQASVLQLYDPHRARAVEHAGLPASREDMQRVLDAARKERGRSVHLLLSPTSSPLIASRIARLRDAMPEVHVWFEPGSAPLAAWEGARRAFGRVLEPDVDFATATLIVALDADPLGTGPTSLRDARAFGQRRRTATPGDRPPRLVVIEPALTCTGIAADVHRRMRASDIGSFVAALLADVLAAIPDASLPANVRSALPAPPPDDRRAKLVRDLVAHRGLCAVIVGPTQPPEVHVLVHALNAALDGRVKYRASSILEASGPSFSHAALLSALDSGSVDLLAISGENPAYDAPVDEQFAARMRRAKTSIVHALYANETAREATWMVPARHLLESWGDARGGDGTVGIVQPLIAPLFGGVGDGELLAMIAGDPLVDDHKALQALHAMPEGEWERALQLGVLEGTAVAASPATPDGGAIVEALRTIRPAKAGLEIRFPLDAKVHDGRYANLGWLQELPDPITKVTWRNAARVSPATAKRFELTTNDEIELTLHDRKERATVVVSPGDADDVITLCRGYGRSGAEELARDLGTNASRLRTTAAPHFERGVALRKTGARQHLAMTQMASSVEGRPIALHKTRSEWQKEPEFAAEHNRPHATLYKLPIVGSPLGNQWGMVIDLSACIGCSACVVACQAENNIAIVGEEGVREGREMHWLRIDRYYDAAHGGDDDPVVITQPMLCQHCEKAPCEYVCPVNATVHSPDGLNEQLYHRCIGTRFCSNNCPYKVRRFNWFEYHHPEKTEKMVFNPNVTVRGRGVMEKCTFCVQRIRRSEITHRVVHEPFRDGDVVTACQQACPTGAIVFGSIADPKSAVSDARRSSRTFAELDELGTEPRVRYLAKIIDPEGEP